MTRTPATSAMTRAVALGEDRGAGCGPGALHAALTKRAAAATETLQPTMRMR